MEYQRQVQAKLRAQMARMHEARKDLDRRQEKRDKQLEKETQRQATHEWWKQPSSSSTLASVHSGGARGTSLGEVRQWSSQANQSVLGNCNNTTINLNSTEEETEVLDLDQTLTEEINVAMEEEGGGRRQQHCQGKRQGGEGEDGQGQERLKQKLNPNHVL